MSATKNKMEKERDKEKEKRGIGRKDSLTDEYTLKDVMFEILKLQTEVIKMQEKQDIQFNRVKEEMTDMRKEMKEEIQTLVKEEISKLREELKITKKEGVMRAEENRVIHNNQTEMRKEMKIIEKELKAIKNQQEIIEIKEKETQLRLHNVQKTEIENIREICTEIIAEVTKKTKEEADCEIERTYRVYSIHSKKFNTPRDIVVHLNKKRVRDEILLNNSKIPGGK
nr:PREDICTED: ribonuclease Y-like [Anolis carolinensis]|eukprot:XP_016853696.1 PREDICTED: ribonuclease Y-like [Anolis carolinensis]